MDEAIACSGRREGPGRAPGRLASGGRGLEAWQAAVRTADGAWGAMVGRRADEALSAAAAEAWPQTRAGATGCPSLPLGPPARVSCSTTARATPLYRDLCQYDRRPRAPPAPLPLVAVCSALTPSTACPKSRPREPLTSGCRNNSTSCNLLHLSARESPPPSAGQALERRLGGLAAIQSTGANRFLPADPAPKGSSQEGTPPATCFSP